jgi:hypothetical protein
MCNAGHELLPGSIGMAEFGRDSTRVSGWKWGMGGSGLYRRERGSLGRRLCKVCEAKGRGLGGRVDGTVGERGYMVVVCFG